MNFARVLQRDRSGTPILWQCSDCGKPFNLGWDSRCNACITAERRHRELVEAVAHCEADADRLFESYRKNYGACLDREKVLLEVVDDLMTAIASDNRTNQSQAHNRAAMKLAALRSAKGASQDAGKERVG